MYTIFSKFSKMSALKEFFFYFLKETDVFYKMRDALL